MRRGEKSDFLTARRQGFGEDDSRVTVVVVIQFSDDEAHEVFPGTEVEDVVEGGEDAVMVEHRDTVFVAR